MFLGTVHSEVETCRFYDVLSTHFVPLKVGGVFLGSYTNLVAVDNELVVLNIGFDVTIKIPCMVSYFSM